MASVDLENAGMLLSNAVADAVERAAAAVVTVRGRRRLPSSGVVFAQDLVLTASHTVERDEDIQVVLPDGNVLEAALAGRDPATDLALLRLSAQTGLSAARPAGGHARVGSLAVAVGRPAAGGPQASFGVVTALGAGLRTQRGALLERYLVTDAVPLPGFSGGPLADLSGGLLGINTSGLVRGISIAIPAETAWNAASSLAQHGRVRRGYLGIRSQAVELPDRAVEILQSAGLGREQPAALLIVGIEADGPAAGGELMVGDILAGLAGRPVADHDDLMAALAGIEPGQTVELQILRGGELKTVRAQTGDRK